MTMSVKKNYLYNLLYQMFVLLVPIVTAPIVAPANTAESAVGATVAVTTDAKPPAVTTVKAAHATIIAAPISQWYQACPSKSMFITGLFPQYAYKFNPFTDSESR